MSKKPKKQGPTQADRANAAVAMAEYNRFKRKYDPLLRKMRDESLTEDTTSTLRARSNADTMQALTSNLSLQDAQRTDAGSDMAQAVQGQLGQATKAGKQIQNRMQTNVLGVARGQAGDAQTGMSQAARLSTSEALARAKAKQDVSLAKFNAAAQIGTALVGQGMDNMSTTGKNGATGSFFTPVDSSGNKVQGAGNRLGYSGFFKREQR